MRNWYAVDVNGALGPVTSVFRPNQPAGVPVRTTQNRRSRFAPPTWVLGTMNEQSPAMSEMQVVNVPTAGVVGALVPS